MMRDKILKAVTQTLKAIEPSLVIYQDSVMQSSKPFYVVLSLEEGGTDNAGLNVQNKSWLVDIAFVDNENNVAKPRTLAEQCGAFFNSLEVDNHTITPNNYLPYETDGIYHVSFTVAFPQLIEWRDA